MKKESVRRAETREQLKHRAAQVGATVGIAGVGTAAFAAASSDDETPVDDVVAQHQPDVAAPSRPAANRPTQAAAPSPQPAPVAEAQQNAAQAHASAISAVSNSDSIDDAIEIEDVEIITEDSAPVPNAAPVPEADVIEFTPASADFETEDDEEDDGFDADDIEIEPDDNLDLALPESGELEFDEPDPEIPGISIAGDL